MKNLTMTMNMILKSNHLPKNNYNFFDDKVIQYTISLKNEIIDSLEKTFLIRIKSNKVKYIKWIEKYLDKDL